MRHICTRCKQTSEDGNLWCQELDCPAGTLPMLFKYGDRLGKIKVTRLLRVLRTANLYEGELDEQTVLLKVANPGQAYEDYLKREAEVCQQLTLNGVEHSGIPKWIQHPEVNGRDPFGLVTFRDQTRFYFLMEHREGDFLGDLLLENPQPWHEHVGWFMMTLAEAVLQIQATTKRLHLNINPDVVMVYRNNLEVPLPYLIDFGLGEPPNRQIIASDVERYQQFMVPAYTPVEMVQGGQLTPATDAYVLGLILYEMLVGKPAYPYELRRTRDIYEDIRTNIRSRLDRHDLPRKPRQAVGGTTLTKTPTGQDSRIDSMTRLVERSIRTEMPSRYRTVQELHQALYILYREVQDKDKRDLRWYIKQGGRVVMYGSVAILLIFAVYTIARAIIG